MASIVASLPPPLLVQGRKTPVRAFPRLPVSPIRERQNRVHVAVKATGDNSESSTSLSISKSVQNIWDNSENRVALIGLGFAAIVAIWASANLVSVFSNALSASTILAKSIAIDKLPLIPTVLEVVGILFSSWFIYRYLLFKPDREELFQICNKTISEILGK